MFRLGPIERQVLGIITDRKDIGTAELVAELYGDDPTPAHRATVSRALRTLCEKGYLIRRHGAALTIPADA